MNNTWIGDLDKRNKLYFWHGPFSQWHPSEFVVDGVKYSHAEQFMMASKAQLFGDSETLAEIMKAKTPKQQKALGKQVKNFDDDVWKAVARNIVYKGTYHKFAQNPDLKDQMMCTSDRAVFVEASPYDKLWGVGLTIEQAAAVHHTKWLGQNWLGQVVTLTRDDIEAGIYRENNFPWED